jgi:hypothetical protein
VNAVRVAWVVAALVGSLSLGVGVVWAFRDTTPPELWLEAPRGPLAAGAPFDVFVSSSKPVTFTLRYGDVIVEDVADQMRVSLLAQAGRRVVQVDAEDAVGLTATVAREIEARRPPRPGLEAPAALDVGDPLVVRVGSGAAGTRWDARVSAVGLTLDGVELPLRASWDGWWALSAVPLEAPAGERTLLARLVDEFGAEHVVRHVFEVRPNPRPIELLQIPASTLAVVTPAGRELEAEALASAFAQVSPEPRWADPFVLPIDGRDTSGFGAPRRYGVGGNVSYHLGADLAAPTGTPIAATNDGVVRIAGMYPIKGGLVVIDHGHGVTSLYFHQSTIEVDVGSVVERGDTIGRVGSTGLSTGPHLHWEMRVNGVPTDPMRWVGVRYPIAGRP